VLTLLNHAINYARQVFTTFSSSSFLPVAGRKSLGENASFSTRATGNRMVRTWLTLTYCIQIKSNFRVYHILDCRDALFSPYVKILDLQSPINVGSRWSDKKRFQCWSHPRKTLAFGVRRSESLLVGPCAESEREQVEDGRERGLDREARERKRRLSSRRRRWKSMPNRSFSLGLRGRFFFCEEKEWHSILGHGEEGSNLIRIERDWS